MLTSRQFNGASLLLVISLVIPSPLAKVVDQRQHVQCDHVEPTYDKETQPGVEVGSWSVFETFSTQNHTEPNPEKSIQHPACLLLKMKLIVRHGNTTLVNIPHWAQHLNDTCNLPEDLNKYDRADNTSTPQAVHLTWNDDGTDNYTDSALTLGFSSGPQQGQHYEQWYWMSRLELETPTVSLKLRDMKVFPTPKLFAYTCKGKKMSFEVTAKVDGQEEKVFLVFQHLEIEAFRKNRFYTSVTHLKWDCQVGWPYKNIALIVNGIIILVVLVSAAFIYLRCRQWENRQRAQEQETRALLPPPIIDESLISFDII